MKTRKFRKVVKADNLDLLTALAWMGILNIIAWGKWFNFTAGVLTALGVFFIFFYIWDYFENREVYWEEIKR